MSLRVLVAEAGAGPFAKPGAAGTYDEVAVAARTLRSGTVGGGMLFGKVC
ncbi:hypothetical protein [Streptomyces sp. NBC_01336]|nr:hypothetical protein OG471_07425 [Streptomyces sp. NBC_01336]